MSLELHDVKNYGDVRVLFASEEPHNDDYVEIEFSNINKEMEELYKRLNQYMDD